MTTAPPLSKLNEALFRATQSADADEVQRQLAREPKSTAAMTTGSRR
jgi:hypothetical protein